MKPLPIRVSVLVSKPIQIVWHHLLTPSSIVQWNQASADWETTTATVDLRVGGRFLSHMQAKDGSFGFDFEGTYTSINPPFYYAYSMDDGRDVAVTLTEQGLFTKVVFLFDPEQENPRQMQEEGWQAILDFFKRFIEK